MIFDNYKIETESPIIAFYVHSIIIKSIISAPFEITLTTGFVSLPGCKKVTYILWASSSAY